MDKSLLAREMSCNIIDEEDTKYIIKEVMGKVTKAISKSLGPYAGTTIARDPYGISHKVTKDGYTILKEITFNGNMQNTILDFIKAVSKSLVQDVGDASTSSVIVANAMYNLLDAYIRQNKGIPRKDILDFLNKLIAVVEEDLRKMSIPIKGNVEKLSNIATISNNNDEELGKLVAHIYEELDFQGFIDMETSPNSNTYREFTNGIEITRGYINFIYTNQKDKITCIYENPRVLLVNEELTEDDCEFMIELLNLSVASGHPLLIIAKEYSPEIRNLLNNNKAKFKDKLPIVPITYRINSNMHLDELMDLGIYLNGTVYNKADGEQLTKKDAGDFFMTKLGECDKVTVNERRTLIIGGHYEQQEIDDRLKSIDELEGFVRAKAGEADITKELYEIERRRSRLKAKIATLYVGGESTFEKETRKYLVDDSIFSCKSAIENGYVLGGNLNIPFLLKNNRISYTARILTENPSLFASLDNKERESIGYALISLFIDSFRSSFYTVLYNKYEKEDYCNKILDECLNGDELKIFNVKLNKYETIEDSVVINSVKTDIEIMKSVVSIVGLLASSNQMMASDTIY